MCHHLTRSKSDFSDSMHEDRLAIFDQPPSTERANKPWIGFLPALHYPSIYWWHYVMVSIIQPWTWDRGLLWLTLSFFIYITAKPVGYIYPKEISINTVKFLYQTIAHLDSSEFPNILLSYNINCLGDSSVFPNSFFPTILIARKGIEVQALWFISEK